MRHIPNGRAFTADDDAMIIALRAQGTSWKLVAHKMGRHLGSVGHRYYMHLREVAA